MDLLFTPVKEIFEDGSTLLEVGIGQSPRKVTGIQKLIQIWVSTFLSDPGYHILDLEGGGGVSSLLGKNNTSYSINDLKGLITASIDKTNKEVSEQQMLEADIDDEELLDSAYLLDVEYIAEDEVNIKIQLISKAGKSQSIIVPLA